VAKEKRRDECYENRPIPVRFLGGQVRSRTAIGTNVVSKGIRAKVILLKNKEKKAADKSAWTILQIVVPCGIRLKWFFATKEHKRNTKETQKRDARSTGEKGPKLTLELFCGSFVFSCGKRKKARRGVKETPVLLTVAILLG
jgi:hypothetical protein